MKDKRGFLLAEETIKIVIAVICIGFLVLFLTNLYFNKITAERQKQASGHFDALGLKFITLRQEGVLKEDTYLISNPIGWSFFSFTGSQIKPSTCGDACVCICDDVYAVHWTSLWTSEEERQAQECGDSGVCLAVPELETDFAKSPDGEEIKKGNIVELKLTKEGDKIRIR